MRTDTCLRQVALVFPQPAAEGFLTDAARTALALALLSCAIVLSGWKSCRSLLLSLVYATVSPIRQACQGTKGDNVSKALSKHGVWSSVGFSRCSLNGMNEGMGIEFAEGLQGNLSLHSTTHWCSFLGFSLSFKSALKGTLAFFGSYPVVFITRF